MIKVWSKQPSVLPSCFHFLNRRAKHSRQTSWLLWTCPTTSNRHQPAGSVLVKWDRYPQVGDWHSCRSGYDSQSAWKLFGVNCCTSRFLQGCMIMIITGHFHDSKFLCVIVQMFCCVDLQSCNHSHLNLKKAASENWARIAFLGMLSWKTRSTNTAGHILKPTSWKQPLGEHFSWVLKEAWLIHWFIEILGEQILVAQFVLFLKVSNT